MTDNEQPGLMPVGGNPVEGLQIWALSLEQKMAEIKQAMADFMTGVETADIGPTARAMQFLVEANQEIGALCILNTLPFQQLATQLAAEYRNQTRGAN